MIYQSNYVSNKKFFQDTNSPEHTFKKKYIEMDARDYELLAEVNQKRESIQATALAGSSINQPLNSRIQLAVVRNRQEEFQDVVNSILR